MNILLTGGTGFIGSYVLEILKKNNNFKILVLSRSKNNKIINDNVIWHSCDLSLPNSYKNIVHEFDPNILIHLSWEGIPDFSHEMCLKNLNSSINFINTVIGIKSIKKIIVTGSCFEYNKLIGSCSETEQCIPKDFFTWAKKSLLDYLALMCKKNNVDYIWARLFYVYGPGQRKNSLIPFLSEMILKNKVPELNTPKNSNDFIHVDDVARCICEMAISKIDSGIYNIGNGFSNSVLKITEIVENEILQSNKITNSLIKKTLNSDKNVDFYADLTKTSKNLNWKPKYSINDGIKDYLKNKI